MLASTVTGAAAPCRSRYWPRSLRQRLLCQDFNRHAEPKTQKVSLNPSARDVGRRDHAAEASGLVRVTGGLHAYCETKAIPLGLSRRRPSRCQWPTRLFPDGKGQAWLKYRIEEMGYLENFLLELYEREAKHEADQVALV